MVPVKYFLKQHMVLCKQVQMLTVPLHIGHMTLYDFLSKLHLLRWTISGATKQPRPHMGYTTRYGVCRPAASLLVASA